jgi:hypothetical protein
MDAAGPPRRDQAVHEAGRQEKRRHADEDERVCGKHVRKNAAMEPGQCQGERHWLRLSEKDDGGKGGADGRLPAHPRLDASGKKDVEEDHQKKTRKTVIFRVHRECTQ